MVMKDFKIGDYIETVDGAIGYISSIDESDSTYTFGYTITRTSDRWSLLDEYHADIADIKDYKLFKRVGNYDLSFMGFPLQEIELLDKDNENMYHITDFAPKINEIITKVNELIKKTN